MLPPLGNPIKSHQEFLSIYSPDVGDALNAFIFHPIAANRAVPTSNGLPLRDINSMWEPIHVELLPLSSVCFDSSPSNIRYWWYWWMECSEQQGQAKAPVKISRTSTWFTSYCTTKKTVLLDSIMCMYGHTYSKSMDQTGKVASPARGQLNRKNDNSLSAFAPKNLVSRDGFGSPVPRQPAHLHTQAESGPYLRDSFRVPRRRPFIYFKSPYAIGSVLSLSGHAIAYRWRSLPRVRRHGARKPQGSSERVLPWQVTMDQLICASLPHAHYWYEVVIACWKYRHYYSNYWYCTDINIIINSVLILDAFRFFFKLRESPASGVRLRATASGSGTLIELQPWCFVDHRGSTVSI